MSGGKSLEMPALGRVAEIGALYDARTDSFIPGVSAFKDLDEEKDLTKTQKHFVDINYSSSDSLSDKMKLFNIKGSLSISAAAGLIKGSGSAEFINDTYESFRDAHFIMNYTLHTEHYQISDLKTVVDKIYKKKDFPDIWKTFKPTHILVGITWGAGYVVECSYKNKDNQDKYKIKAKFDLSVSQGSVVVKGKASGNYTKDDIQKDENFSFTAKCDVYDYSKKLPKDFQEVKDTALGLAKFVSNINGGKGVPMVYYLIPYENFKKFLIEAPEVTAPAEIKDHIINGCLQKLEHATGIIKKLNDLYSDMVTNSQFFTCDEEKKFSMDLNKLKNVLDKTKGEFGEELIKVRKGDEGYKPEKLVEFLENKLEKAPEFAQSYYDIAYNLLESWRKQIRHRIDFVEVFKRRKIPFLGSEKSFQNMMAEKMDEMVAFFLFSSYEEIGRANMESLEEINEFIKACMKLKEINEKEPYFVVDGKLHEDALTEYKTPSDKCTTYYLDCGKMVTKDEWIKKIEEAIEKKNKEEEEQRRKDAEKEEKKNSQSKSSGENEDKTKDVEEEKLKEGAKDEREEKMKKGTKDVEEK